MTGGVPDETANGTFTMRAINNRNFISSSPMSVTVEADSGGKANDTVSLTAPANVTLGTDVTLTIVAENEDATDLNFAVLRFSVGAEVREEQSRLFQILINSVVISWFREEKSFMLSERCFKWFSLLFE